MSEGSNLRVAVVGLGKGADFAPIYLNHPNVSALTIVDLEPARLEAVGTRFGVELRRQSFDQVVNADDIDAIHLCTPLVDHARQAIAVLDAGKHCACASPAALSLEDLQRIIDAQRRSGRTYMMMESGVYTRSFLYVKEMLARGDMGSLSFLRGALAQDMEGFPAYWRGIAPMLHATKAFAPILALAGGPAAAVSCMGSGAVRRELTGGAHMFRVESALVRMANSNLAAEVTRQFYETARPFTESFSVYGDRVGFEWPQFEHEEPLLFNLGPLRAGRRGRDSNAQRVRPPDRPDLLPFAISRFTALRLYDDTNPASFRIGGTQQGALPHLVHEFISSIVQNRAPAIDAVTAAHWTAPGICAHASALKGGELVKVPEFV